VSTPESNREFMNIVVVGHVDHGKSTVVGRLLADTGSLPEGKLEAVREFCRRNARPFEYAFLLDALKDEQAQGITIDSARCFFKTAARDYLIIDAPGHVEFLKNMVSGAARAEAALLVIDAHEGIRENSRRHATMLAMLGVRQLVVLVNKMDLVGYDLDVFARISAEYEEFLHKVGLTAAAFVPIAAREGVNLTTRADWYTGQTVLERLDAFPMEPSPVAKPFRLPLQDVYKFTARGDDRRILVGTVETGTLRPGDDVVFLPSGKRTRVRSIESFHHAAPLLAQAGEAQGFTMTEELYVRPGELMCRADQSPPHVGTRFRASVFWMGKAPLLPDKPYKLKLAAARVPVRLAEIISVMDASDLSLSGIRTQVDRHEVAECIFETSRPVAFDLAADMQATGRFVLVDHYEIAGGGIVLATSDDDTQTTLADHVARREASWEGGAVALSEREGRNGHRAKLVVFVGEDDARLGEVGRALERRLFDGGFASYYLGLANLERGLDAEVLDTFEVREGRLRRLGELARILTDSGQIVVTTVSDTEQADLETLRALNAPQEILTIRLDTGPRDRCAGLETTLRLAASATTDILVAEVWSELGRSQILPEYAI